MTAIAAAALKFNVAKSSTNCNDGAPASERPRRRALIRTRSRRVPPGPFYNAASGSRPKLWSGSPTPPSPDASASKAPEASEGRKRPLSSGEDGSAASPCLIVSKKRRRVSSLPSSRRSLSFLSSDLLRRRYGSLGSGDGGDERTKKSSEKSVAFADPVVTETRVRPRTPRQDVRALFYNKADEARFREEVRRERRLRAMGCVSDSESDNDDEEADVVITESDDSGCSSSDEEDANDAFDDSSDSSSDEDD